MQFGEHSCCTVSADAARRAVPRRQLSLLPLFRLPIQVDTSELRHATFILYLVTFVVGALGNTLTIVALACAAKRSAAMCFMLNLAIADDLFIASLPFKAHSTLTGRWAFGAGACKLLSVFYSVRIFSSAPFFSSPRSEGSPHHGRTLSIHIIMVYFVCSL